MNNIDFDYNAFAGEFKKSLVYGDSLRKISKETKISAPTLSRALKGNKIELLTAIKMAFFMKRDLKDFVIKK